MSGGRPERNNLVTPQLQKLQDYWVRCSSEQDSCARIGKTLHIQPPGPYLLDGVRYHSRPEAACGYLLEQYLSRFVISPGETFQVPVDVSSGGDLQTIDFRYGDVFLEYHPPRIHRYGGRVRRANQRRREPRELRKLRELCCRRRLPAHIRERNFYNLKMYLTRRYTKQRMELLSQSPLVDSFDLVVAGSPRELHRDFLSKYSSGPLPRYPVFEREFKALLKEVQEVR